MSVGQDPRARLYTLIPRLSQSQLEALLAVAEAFAKDHDAQTTVCAPAPPHPPAELGTPTVLAQLQSDQSLADARATRTVPGPAQPERLTWTVPETAALLGVSVSLLWDEIRAGRLPAVRIGRRVLLSRTALEELVASAESGLQSTGKRPAGPRKRAAP